MRRARQFLRPLVLRCPLCGKPWPRVGRLTLAPQCPVCQVYLERHEHDFFLGSYTINLFGTLVVAALAAFAIGRWIPWPIMLRYAASAVVIVAFALWFYPRSKLLWLAVDALFRPPEEKDFDG